MLEVQLLRSGCTKEDKRSSLVPSVPSRKPTSLSLLPGMLLHAWHAHRQTGKDSALKTLIAEIVASILQRELYAHLRGRPFFHGATNPCRLDPQCGI